MHNHQLEKTKMRNLRNDIELQNFKSFFGIYTSIQSVTFKLWCIKRSQQKIQERIDKSKIQIKYF